jgi:hypothetical protein
MWAEFVDTNAIKSSEFNSYRLNIRFLFSRITLATVTIDASPETLDCDDCVLVDVHEVIDANTLLTSNGEIQLYGAYILEQPDD